jgi:hypothetical protein
MTIGAPRLVRGPFVDPWDLQTKDCGGIAATSTIISMTTRQGRLSVGRRCLGNAAARMSGESRLRRRSVGQCAAMAAIAHNFADEETGPSQ